MMDFLQRAEAALLWCIYQGVRLLPVDLASALVGRIARVLGPLLPPSQRARRNLELAMPDRGDHDLIIRDMWENLGRIVGEYPHTLRFKHEPERMELVGTETIIARRDAGQPMLFFSAHLGNWELTYPLMDRLHVPGGGVFRAPNNPYLGWLFDRRAAYPDIELIPKGAAGARKSIEVLKSGRSLAMLVDQKMNDGIEVPFFGRPAMTAPALASLALKFDYPVIPVRVVRTEGAHFRVEFHEPLHFAKTGDRAADLTAAMTQVNRVLEGWISEIPSQWLWLHRRWAKELYRKS